jgi:hypothetical protein
MVEEPEYETIALVGGDCELTTIEAEQLRKIGLPECVNDLNPD